MRFKRWLPLVLIIALLGTFFYFHAYDYVSFGVLKAHHDTLAAWTAEHYTLAVLIFIGLYIFVTAVSIPVATLLTLVGGFLFGLVWGTVFVVFSATIGASLLFLAVRSSFGSWFEQRARGWIKKMERGFKADAFNYLLTLRFIPIFPFFLVNIISALLNIPFKTFVIATAIGITPASIIYISIGNGLESIFASNQPLQLNIIFTPKILLPLLGLAVLALAPVIYKKFFAREK